MKNILQYLISLIIFIILICGSDGCSDNPSSPAGNGNPSSDSLFYQADYLYAHGVPGIISFSDTIYSCEFKSVRVTFRASTNDTSQGPNSCGLGIGFHSVRYPLPFGLSGIDLIGRNINLTCDTILDVTDTLPHNLQFGYILVTHNQPFGDTTRYIRVDSLKIYKHN